MPGPGPILREIHRLRRFTRDLDQELDRGPKALKIQEARVAHQEELRKTAQDELKKLKVSTHEQEGTLRSKILQVAKHEKQLNEASGKKEYDALQHEIAAEKKSCQELEDDILSCLEKIETDTARLPEFDQAVLKAKDELAQFKSGYDSRRTGLAEQLAQAQKELAKVEADLPEDVRPLYDRELASRGEDGMSAIHARTCLACHTEITAQNYNELLQGRWVVCKSCGRILYLPESSA
jgi:predicted  nucleic acid-binding Zn-ribbon protein